MLEDGQREERDVDELCQLPYLEGAPSRPTKAQLCPVRGLYPTVRGGFSILVCKIVLYCMVYCIVTVYCIVYYIVYCCTKEQQDSEVKCKL